MKRVLLTGATGFVGANLARRLLQDGHEVHGLVRPQHQTWRIDDIRGQVRWHEVSLEDGDGVAAAVGRIRPEWIFHLAAYGAYPEQTDLKRIMAVNFTGTVNLVEASLKSGFEAFVNTGSSSEYGYKDHAPAETEWLEPNSHYAVSKAAATQFCRFTAQKTKTNIQTLRLYSVYGPYEEPTRLIPTVIRRALTQGDLPPLVNPTIARDFVYVDDTVNAYLKAAVSLSHEPGAIYNVGTGQQTTVADVVDAARKLFHTKAEPRWNSMADRQWDTGIWVANVQKIKNVLGWEPVVRFDRGFQSAAAWWKENPRP